MLHFHFIQYNSVFKMSRLNNFAGLFPFCALISAVLSNYKASSVSMSLVEVNLKHENALELVLRGIAQVFRFTEIVYCANFSSNYPSILEEMGDLWLYTGGFQISVRNSSSSGLKAFFESIYDFDKEGSTNLILDLRSSTENLKALKLLSSNYKRTSGLVKNNNVFVLWSSPDWDWDGIEEKAEITSLARTLPLNSFIYLVPCPNETELGIKYDIWELYSVNQQVFINRLDVKSLHLYEFLVTHPSRLNLQSATIKAVAIKTEDERFSASFSPADEGFGYKFNGGFTVRLLTDLQNALNFSVRAVAGQAYISDENNGTTLGGMGRQLLNEEADVIITMSYILPFRLKFATSSIPIHADKIRVFFKQPSKNSHKNLFLNPLKKVAWIYLFLLSISLLGFALFAQKVYEKVSKRERNLDPFYMWILAGLLLKSSPIPSGAGSVPKLLLLSALIMSSVLYAFYSASIISRLAIYRGAIHSLSDLFVHDFKLIADPLFHYTNLTMLSDEDVSIWENRYISDTDAVRKVFSGGYGFISSLDLIYIAAGSLNISDGPICHLVSSTSLNGLVLPLSFFYTKNSPIKEIFNLKLLDIMGKGLRERYRREFLWNTSPKCEDVGTIGNNLEVIQLQDIISAFRLLLACIIGSLFILVGELWAYPRRKR